MKLKKNTGQAKCAGLKKSQARVPSWTSLPNLWPKLWTPMGPLRFFLFNYMMKKMEAN
jgi:hypothetical protein